MFVSSYIVFCNVWGHWGEGCVSSRLEGGLQILVERLAANLFMAFQENPSLRDMPQSARHASKDLQRFLTASAANHGVCRLSNSRNPISELQLGTIFSRGHLSNQIFSDLDVIPLQSQLELINLPIFRND